MDDLIKRVINYCEEACGAGLGADDIFATYAPLFHDAIRDAVARERWECAEAVKFAANNIQTDNEYEYKGYKADIVAGLAAIRARSK